MTTGILELTATANCHQRWRNPDFPLEAWKGSYGPQHWRWGWVGQLESYTSRGRHPPLFPHTMTILLLAKAGGHKLPRVWGGSSAAGGAALQARPPELDHSVRGKAAARGGSTKLSFDRHMQAIQSELVSLKHLYLGATLDALSRLY